MNQPSNDTLEKLSQLRETFKVKLIERLDTIKQNSNSFCAPIRQDDNNVKAGEELKNASHKLAGAAGTFGFQTISNLGKELELLTDEILNRDALPTKSEKKKIQGIVNKIEVESTKDTASSVQVTQWETFSKKNKPSSESDLQHKTIMLVDDDLELTQSLKEQLSYFGFNLITHLNTSDLENSLILEKPSVLIMDVAFPGDVDGGVKEIQRLKNENKLNCPVIFLSIRDDMEARLSAVRLGAAGYYVKPIEILDLVDLLVRITKNGDENPFKVAIVDDDQEVASFNAELLQEAGFETLTLNDPMDAINPIRKFKPDVMLIDIQMPECNGFELSQVIRQDNDFIQVPIVFLTGQTIEDPWLHSMESGGDEFIRKTGASKELIAAVTGRAKRARKLNEIINNLAENEARYSALADATKEGFVTIDKNLKVISWNKGAEDILGYKAHEIIGKSVTILYPDSSKLEKNKPDTEINNNGLHPLNGQTTETTRIHKNGYSVPVEISITSWKIKEKIFTTSIVQDISIRKQNEKNLKQSEARNRSIVENTAEGIISIDSQSNILTFNLAAEKMFGYSADEIIGQGVSLLVPSSERHHHDQYVAQSNLHAPRIINNSRDLFGRRKDGTQFPMELTVSKMDVDNEQMFVGIMHDISERKETELALKEAEKNTRIILESAAEGIYGLDEKGKVTFINPAACKMLGYEADELIGKSMHEIIHHSYPDGSEYPKDKCTMYAAFKDLEVHKTDDEVLWCKNGTSFPVKHISTPILKEGVAVGVVINFSDITQEATAKKKLEAAKVEAERANKAKSEFLSSMSHELRTPMNAIIGFGQMLEFNDKDPLTPAQKKCVDHILSGGKHLLDLINEVLDLSRIEAGKLQLSLEKISLSEVVSECINLSETLADKRNIKIETCKECTRKTEVYADRVRLKQVILNLLSNAIKYNRIDGQVTINCSKTDSNTLRISITDTGDGIPADQQGDLFTPFNRLGAESSGIEGTGIGLALTKNLIEAMGGSVDFMSIPGKGSTFWIEAPITKKTSSVESAPVDNSETVLASPFDADMGMSGIKGKILYVEDNPANMDLMKLIISRINGLTFLSAKEGKTGIEIAIKEKPDVIILDINLPGIDGFGVLKRLQNFPETKNTPILALSASAMPTEVEKGIAAGFRQYLAKPLKVTETLNAIKNAIEENKK
ncbi:MAG: PAS domain S-box protein [Rhodospirillales bacterium]|nr:PAS domain S-box protein [Rhodospirillales bacterium]